MYWRWQSLPELADLTPAERKVVWRRARRDPLRPGDLGWLVLILVSVVLLSILFVWLAGRHSWIDLLGCLAAFAVEQWILAAVMVRRYRPVVRRLRVGELWRGQGDDSGEARTTVIVGGLAVFVALVVWWALR